MRHGCIEKQSSTRQEVLEGDTHHLVMHNILILFHEVSNNRIKTRSAILQQGIHHQAASKVRCLCTHTNDTHDTTQHDICTSNNNIHISNPQSKQPADKTAYGINIKLPRWSICGSSLCWRLPSGYASMVCRAADVGTVPDTDL